MINTEDSYYQTGFEKEEEFKSLIKKDRFCLKKSLIKIMGFVLLKRTICHIHTNMLVVTKLPFSSTNHMKTVDFSGGGSIYIYMYYYIYIYISYIKNYTVFVCVFSFCCCIESLNSVISENI